jgi:hypothetical protein
MNAARALFEPAAPSAIVRLPAITLWQYWASAGLIPELKPTETRHWPAPARLIGCRFAMHAAARPVEDAADETVAAALRSHFGSLWRKTLPRSAVVGTVVLAAVEPMTTASPRHANDEAFGHWAADRWAWRLADPVVFKTPFPCAGRQSWFTVDLPRGLVQP